MKMMMRCCGKPVLLALSAGFLFVNLPADVITRDYRNCNDYVSAGEVKSRDIYACEPSPYEGTSPFAVSFAPKFEAPSETWDVVMLRLNVLVGRHRAVYALDAGVLGNMVDYKMDGIGVAGLFNSVGESDGAIHIAGLFNFAAFDFSGCQVSGIYSGTEGSHCGAQVGTANYAGSLTGLQVGVFNFAERLCGVQVGVFNFSNSSWVRVLPILNAAF